MALRLLVLRAGSPPSSLAPLAALAATGLVVAQLRDESKPAQCGRHAVQQRSGSWSGGGGGGSGRPGPVQLSSVATAGSASTESTHLSLAGIVDRQNHPMMSDAEIVSVATLINDMVDLQFFDEAEEQIIFEHCVRNVATEIERALTPVHLSMIHAGLRQGISEEHAQCLQKRLFEHVDMTVKFPFLDACEARRIKKCVIALVVHCMATGKTIMEICEDGAHDMFVDILMKSIVSRFFDETEKAELTGEIAESMSNVPFVPLSLVVAVIRRVINCVGEYVSEALVMTYTEVTEQYQAGGGPSDQLSIAPTHSQRPESKDLEYDHKLVKRAMAQLAATPPDPEKSPVASPADAPCGETSKASETGEPAKAAPSVVGEQTDATDSFGLRFHRNMAVVLIHRLGLPVFKEAQAAVVVRAVEVLIKDLGFDKLDALLEDCKERQQPPGRSAPGGVVAETQASVKDSAAGRSRKGWFW